MVFTKFKFKKNRRNNILEGNVSFESLESSIRSNVADDQKIKEKKERKKKLK